jgi:hypothetical protein
MGTSLKADNASLQVNLVLRCHQALITKKPEVYLKSIIAPFPLDNHSTGDIMISTPREINYD